MSQAQFGPALGASHRTAVRWDGGRSDPGADALCKLAALLVPHDLALAAEAAAHAGETLESLGLVVPPPPPPPPPARSKPEVLIDAVLCAAANQAGAVPETMRPILHAAFRRAREVGLSLEEAERALAAGDGAKGAEDRGARKALPST